MKIELKKFKHYPRLSEETAAFNADVYVDGILTAYAENEGKGGCNRIEPAQPHFRAKVQEMEAWALTQPAVEGLKMDLDFYISLMVDDMINEKIYAKNRKVFEQFTDAQLVKILEFNGMGNAFANGHDRTSVISNMGRDAGKGLIKLPSRQQWAAVMQ